MGQSQIPQICPSRASKASGKDLCRFRTCCISEFGQLLDASKESRPHCSKQENVLRGGGVYTCHLGTSSQIVKMCSTQESLACPLENIGLKGDTCAVKIGRFLHCTLKFISIPIPLQAQ